MLRNAPKNGILLCEYLGGSFCLTDGMKGPAATGLGRSGAGDGNAAQYVWIFDMDRGAFTPTLNWTGKDKAVTHHLDAPYRVLERGHPCPAPADGMSAEIWAQRSKGLRARSVYRDDKTFIDKGLVVVPATVGFTAYMAQARPGMEPMTDRGRRGSRRAWRTLK